MKDENCEKIKNVLRVIFYPLVLIRRKIFVYLCEYYMKRDLKKLASLLYYNISHKKINWSSPKNLNEKINWLKLYGVWDDACDIDFNLLPTSFVLKTNHGCGTIIVVKNKNSINEDEVRKQLNTWLQLKFGTIYAEPHYNSIKPKIIAEEYLKNDNANSTSLVDYKVFCLEGKPYSILVCADRVLYKGCCLAWYDLEWNPKPDMLSGGHKQDCVTIEKPTCLSDMLQAAEILSKGHHQVRIDFYITNGKLYFGEMTFTSLGGYMSYIAPKYLDEMGSLIHL